MSSMGGCVFYSATIPGQWIASIRISNTGDCMSLYVRFPRMFRFQYTWSWHSRNCNYFPCFAHPRQPLGTKLSSLCVRFYSTLIVRGTLLTRVGGIVHSMKTRIVECNSVPNMNSALRKAQYKRNMIRNKFKKKMESNTGKIIIPRTPRQPPAILSSTPQLAWAATWPQWAVSWLAAARLIIF